MFVAPHCYSYTIDASDMKLWEVVLSTLSKVSSIVTFREN